MLHQVSHLMKFGRLSYEISREGWVGLKWRVVARKKRFWQGPEGRFSERQRMNEAIPWKSININTINNWCPIQQQQQKQSESTLGRTEIESAHSSLIKRFCSHIGAWYARNLLQSYLNVQSLSMNFLSWSHIRTKFAALSHRTTYRGAEWNAPFLPQASARIVFAIQCKWYIMD
jgi:hypothetical protein